MHKKMFTVLILFLFAAPVYSDNVQKPVVAGSFYPAEPLILAGQVDKYIKDVPAQKIDGKILALISPHAGLVYCGPAAAYGYKALIGQDIDTVVIIGPSHYIAFDGVSILDKGYYETPLGRVVIDSEFAKELEKTKKDIIYYQPQAYKEEHSVEVQIPFLQRVLKDFKVVPLIMGRPDYKTCKDLAKALVSAIKSGDKKVIIIASTDLSHYYSYNDAVMKDQATLSELIRLDPLRFAERVSAGECELCGSAPVITVLLAAKEIGADKIRVLKYANSGDTAGDKSRVVGYGSIVIYREEKTMLNDEQKKALLNIARQTIENYIKTGKISEFKEMDPALLKIQGAFVTLRENGELRGCIGNIMGQQPLYLTVRDMAIESAARDPRFSPVSAGELKDIKIEISVLSEPKKVNNISEIEMGVHGVIVKRGLRSGVFLPQVAEETGWNREEFLSNLCAHKAGLSADAWKDKDTQLYTFAAQVFEEAEK